MGATIMKIVTLMENEACSDKLAAAHGLSLYIETPKHKILFDMGPDDNFFYNAKKLGIDLSAVDVAILSHGHRDHGGGLKTFSQLNAKAAIYIHQDAFGGYYAEKPEGLKYIGLDQTIDASCFAMTADEEIIDDELMLFANVPDLVGALASSHMQRRMTEDGLQQDIFTHEQNLLITAEGKAVLIAGCAHRGIVNILRKVTDRTGRKPNVTFGGFHLFQLPKDSPESDKLIEKTGHSLLEGDTLYFTGHCTGDYAYEKLKDILGDRLQRIRGGTIIEL